MHGEKKINIAATSFIWPETRLYNAKKLVKFVNEIQLLYFQSKSDFDCTEDYEVMALSALPLDYTVHLPVDLDLSKSAGKKIMDSLIDKLLFLSPKAFIIHPINSDVFKEYIVKLSNTIQPNIYIENIDSNINIFRQYKELNIPLCFDIGHALLQNVPVKNFIKQFRNSIKYIHLHGLNKNKDHQSIIHLDKKLLEYIIGFAKDYDITICLELFNKIDFFESLNIINNMVVR